MKPFIVCADIEYKKLLNETAYSTIRRIEGLKRKYESEMRENDETPAEFFLRKIETYGGVKNIKPLSSKIGTQFGRNIHIQLAKDLPLEKIFGFSYGKSIQDADQIKNIKNIHSIKEVLYIDNNNKEIVAIDYGKFEFLETLEKRLKK